MEAQSEPLKIVLATTGFSTLVDYLRRHPAVEVAGLIECGDRSLPCLDYARTHGIDHIFYTDHQYAGAWLAEKKADLLITWKVPFILPGYVFCTPRLGSVNIHPSLLPLYRGPEPWFWVYYNKEQQSGVTIHRIDRYADHGDILAQDAFDIVQGSDLASLRLEAEKTAVGLLGQILPHLETMEARSQGDASGLPRAPGGYDPAELLDPAKTDVKRMWHVLRGFPSLLSSICPDLKGNYTVGDYSHVPPENSEHGFYHADGKSWLGCLDGRIELLPNGRL